MSEAYEDVVAMEAIDDLVEAIERTIDANETEGAIIGTALSILTATFVGRYANAEGRKQFAKNITELMHPFTSQAKHQNEKAARALVLFVEQEHCDMTNETIAKLIDNGDDFERKWQLMEQRRVELTDQAQMHNKPVLFDILDRLGVARVEVCFDGYGDSGQIEEITAFDAAGNQIADVSGALTIKTVNESRPVDKDGFHIEVEEKESSVKEGIETICYDCLRATHDGWENSIDEYDGAYGTFVFDVAARAVKLNISERYIVTKEFEHEF
jgi:hypothetical protein